MSILSAKIMGGGLATISMAGSGMGMGLIFGSLLMAFSSNPSARTDLFNYAIMGFALTEAIALFGLMMAFMLLFAF